MSKIDCSMMSHPACYEPAELDGTEDAPPTTEDSDAAAFGSYDCINDCVSSLGVPGLVAGAVTGLSCLALTPVGCALVLVGAPSVMAAACNDGCAELESK